MPSFGKLVKQEELFYMADESRNWDKYFESYLAIIGESKIPNSMTQQAPSKVCAHSCVDEETFTRIFMAALPGRDQIGNCLSGYQ